MSDEAIGKYLARHAEREAAVVSSPPSAAVLDERFGPGCAWGQAVVVPVYREDPAFVEGLKAACSAVAHRVLLILVANAPIDANAADVEWCQRFPREFQEQCTGWVPLLAEDEPNSPTLGAGGRTGLDVILVDRSTPGFRLARSHGVGLARKIGNDVALALWRDGRVRTPWIYQLDADATPPVEHLARPLPEGEGAIVFPFTHVPGSDVSAYEATLKHEAWLRYHVLGLRWAGSRYAWHAIGSCMAVHARSLAIVRGFPKRNAAEDFHLLQKISKVAPVHSVEGAPVRILARRSDRAPVGTGAAVARAIAEPAVLFESPECYAILKAWLAQLERFTHTRDLQQLNDDAADLDGRQVALGELRAMGCFERLQMLSSEASTQPDLLRRVYDWFDGIKSLHLLHALRRAGRAKLPALEALRLAPFTSDVAVPELEDSSHWRGLCDGLARLEYAEPSRLVRPC